MCSSARFNFENRIHHYRLYFQCRKIPCTETTSSPRLLLKLCQNIKQTTHMWYTSAPNTVSFDTHTHIYIYIYILLLCNNILKNDTTLRATKTDPLLLLTYRTLLGDRRLEFVVPKADAKVLNKQLPYKAITRNKQFHDLFVF